MAEAAAANSPQQPRRLWGRPLWPPEGQPRGLPLQSRSFAEFVLSERTGEILRSHENNSPPPKEERVGSGGCMPGNHHPLPLLNKEGNRNIFMPSDEPKDHEIFAQSDSEGFTMTKPGRRSTPCLAKSANSKSCP